MLSIQVCLPAGVDEVRIGWSGAIKPVALDEILWEAFLPDADFGGPRQRRTRRINGAFIVDPLPIGIGTREAPVADEPAPHLDLIVDEFMALRTDFVGRYPDIAGLLAADRAAQSTLNAKRRQLREIVTLIALGRRDEAAAIADAELAQGNHGPYSSPHAGVFEWLSLHCKPPEVMEQFRASLVPTHQREIIAETSRSGRGVGTAAP